MRLHGARSDEQLLRDLRDGQATGKAAENLLLPLAQHGRVRGRPHPDLAGQRPGQLGRDHGVSGGDPHHRIDDLAAPGIFRQVASGSLLEGPEDHGAIGDRRQQQHPRRQMIAHHGVHDGHSIHFRHLVVDDSNGRFFAANQVECVAAVLGLADNVHSAAVGQPADHAVAKERVVVDDDDRHPRVRHPHAHMLMRRLGGAAPRPRTS
jgi:hypothetical protein